MSNFVCSSGRLRYLSQLAFSLFSICSNIGFNVKKYRASIVFALRGKSVTAKIVEEARHLIEIGFEHIYIHNYAKTVILFDVKAFYLFFYYASVCFYVLFSFPSYCVNFSCSSSLLLFFTCQEAFPFQFIKKRI